MQQSLVLALNIVGAVSRQHSTDFSCAKTRVVKTEERTGFCLAGAVPKSKELWRQQLASLQTQLKPSKHHSKARRQPGQEWQPRQQAEEDLVAAPIKGSQQGLKEPSRNWDVAVEDEEVVIEGEEEEVVDIFSSEPGKSSSDLTAIAGKLSSISCSKRRQNITE